MVTGFVHPCGRQLWKVKISEFGNRPLPGPQQLTDKAAHNSSVDHYMVQVTNAWSKANYFAPHHRWLAARKVEDEPDEESKSAPVALLSDHRSSSARCEGIFQINSPLDWQKPTGKHLLRLERVYVYFDAHFVFWFTERARQTKRHTESRAQNAIVCCLLENYRGDSTITNVDV